MKVYVVNTVEYCDTLCGVFSSEEKAKEAIKIMKEIDDTENNFTIEDWYNEFVIEEMELDKVYNIML